MNYATILPGMQTPKVDDGIDGVIEPILSIPEPDIQNECIRRLINILCSRRREHLQCLEKEVEMMREQVKILESITR